MAKVQACTGFALILKNSNAFLSIYGHQRTFRISNMVNAESRSGFYSFRMTGVPLLLRMLK